MLDTKSNHPKIITISVLSKKLSLNTLGIFGQVSIKKKNTPSAVTY